MGGDDSPENLVLLTAEEHFVAHQMLAKIHQGHQGIMYAAFAMGNESNRKYGWLRRSMSKASRDAALKQWSDPSHRSLISKLQLGKKASKETKLKLSSSLKSYFSSDDARRKVSEATSRHFADPAKRLDVSEKMKLIWSNQDHVQRMSGRKRDDDAIERIKIGMSNQPKRICPHCGKEGKGGNMTRFHFENCSSPKRNAEGA